jgi:phosphopantetheinyl transferase (holo-ACP synthase)
MIGNDIVDLQVAKKESNWNRPRFLQKVFTTEEREYINRAPDKNKAVWLLWSKKESAYKIIVRHLQKRFFAPKELMNTIDTTDCHNYQLKHLGLVTFGKYLIHTRSTITNRYIHTIAQEHNDFTNLNVDCFSIDKNEYPAQHQTTHHRVIQHYSKMTQSSANFKIRKSALKVPSLYAGDKKLKVHISTSHHGNYGGFALESTSLK